MAQKGAQKYQFIQKYFIGEEVMILVLAAVMGLTPYR